jgi:predicted component of type VI protein secretion system
MLTVELKVLEGRQQGKTIPLNVRQFLIGREEDCHLRPNSDLVSRHHCVFTVDDFTVRLRDLGSTNGTFVNGERIQGQVVLKPGDHVAVGKLSFEIVVRKAAAVAVPAAAGSDDSSSSVVTDAPATTPGVESMETSLNVTDTVEIPVAPPGDDTTVLEKFVPPDPAQQQPQGFLPSAAFPQGYGMPQGYPMPGYYPGYPQGYGMPAGYPQPGYGAPGGYMQPGYGVQPMMPGYSVPQQPAAPAGARTVEAPPVVLPDPSETGAKAPAPPPPAPPAAEGQAPAPPASKNPSDAAADIIRSHRTRRP